MKTLILILMLCSSCFGSDSIYGYTKIMVNPEGFVFKIDFNKSGDNQIILSEDSFDDITGRYSQLVDRIKSLSKDFSNLSFELAEYKINKSTPALSINDKIDLIKGEITLLKMDIKILNSRIDLIRFKIDKK